jgi:hypothetical protein
VVGPCEHSNELPGFTKGVKFPDQMSNFKLLVKALLHVGNVHVIQFYSKVCPVYSSRIRRCTQKFPDWPHGEKTANGTALCH